MTTQAPTPTAQVTVIVINWNGAHLLPDCLDALAAQDLPDTDWQCWVVDNASTDDSRTLLADNYPWVHVLPQDSNLGFAAGNNVAIAQATTTYVALLNNDAHPAKDWLSTLLAATKEPGAADIAAWTSKVIFATPKATLTPDTASAGEIDVINNAGSILLPDGSGADRGYGQPDAGQYDTAEEVFLFSGTAVLLRQEALDQVGVFDERFFMYYEDTDLSWRLRAAGWRIRYEPAAVVAHIHSASSVEWSPFFTYHVERNRLALLARNTPLRFAGRQALRYQLTTASQIRRALVEAWRQRRRPTVRPTLLRLRVTASFAGMLPGLLTRRRASRHQRVNTPRSIMDRWVTERC